MDEPSSDSRDELTLLSRDELERRVRQRTADLENVMDTMVDVLVKLDPDGRIRMTNAAVTDVLGYDRESLEGRPIDHILVDDHRNPQGSAAVSAEEFVETLIREDHVTEFETALVTADDETIPTSLSASVLRDDDGAIEGIVCVATDISERVAAEERAAFLHSLLRHDLNNKLTVTYGYLELLSESPALTEQERQYLDYAVGGIEDAMDLVENVETLNRLETDEAVRPVDLVPVLEESAARHDDLAERNGLEVCVEVDANVTVSAGTLLTELFSNLIENALVHSEGSVVRITATACEPTVRVAVDDDGQGIPSDRQDSILERGETAGETGGSGLGTHLAKRIADGYGGDLTVEDSPLGGTRFVVTLRTPSE
ncbi:PAS domain S-box protein [Natronorubrum sp. JWXQ-INN-674]|uniref:histidine kinase n=1 Tax=Natronorubrum halalkaliphilum TaxID=2691917 RepID=A0A6B0VT01_9EURY|nr:PAS domain-containing sensor histidine kinase [Natronorubrum halalkaliphilum]MXV64545.1 PAS domain S-box protein [Natronorubrum halalkaliphilum]